LLLLPSRLLKLRLLSFLLLLHPRQKLRPPPSQLLSLQLLKLQFLSRPLLLLPLLKLP
jgi:hypothetical protein